MPFHVKLFAAHQISDCDRGLSRQAEFPQRHLERRFLRDVRIKADRDQDHAAVERITFAVQNDLVVEGVDRMSDPRWDLQRRMLRAGSGSAR